MRSFLSKNREIISFGYKRKLMLEKDEFIYVCRQLTHGPRLKLLESKSERRMRSKRNKSAKIFLVLR